jgi:hypothetical protein
LEQSSDKGPLARLERGLRGAESQREANPRAAVKAALEAVLQFLHHTQPQWTGDQIHRPLVDLFAALSDLDMGRRVPLLEPTRFGNRHPDAWLLKMKQAWAIFAIERLVRMGENATIASKKVAAIWNQCAGETRKWPTLKSWYDRRNKLPEEDTAFVALINLRALSDPDNLDQPSAAAAQHALRANGINIELKNLVANTETDVLDLLVQALTVIGKSKPES